jgi:hypothetical protein
MFHFYGDPIYNIEGTSQIKDTKKISSKDFFLQPDGPYMCQPDADMVTDLFHPFDDDLMQHFHDDFQWPSHVSYDAYLFCEDFQPSCLDFDRHQVMASSGHSKVHTKK